VKYKMVDLFKLVIKLVSLRSIWLTMFDPVIRLLSKHYLSIMTVLHDMVRIVWKNDAPDSWHVETRL